MQPQCGPVTCSTCTMQGKPHTPRGRWHCPWAFSLVFRLVDDSTLPGLATMEMWAPSRDAFHCCGRRLLCHTPSAPHWRHASCRIRLRPLHSPRVTRRAPLRHPSHLRCEKLDALGLNWAAHRNWQTGFVSLLSFRMHYGHVKVPRSKVSEQALEGTHEGLLCRWIDRQRWRKTTGSLTEVWLSSRTHCHQRLLRLPFWPG